MLPGAVRVVTAILSFAVVLPAGAAEPVRHIAIYVQPYYESAATSGGAPRVAVGKQFDALLGSNRRQDIVAARDAIRARPELVTPMTLMVLAIRLYDVGLRDESVFWFYVAKDRFVTLAEVLDMRASSLAQVEQATRDFATLAGPVINGYAFCDVAKQQQAQQKALAWVEANPYQALFIPKLPARPGDRRANLGRALEMLRAGIDKERRHLEQPDNLKTLAEARRKNGADAKYCWQS